MTTPSQCPQCRHWYVPTPGMENVSCCVLHGGGCCHYTETRVDPPRTETTGVIENLFPPDRDPGDE